MRVVFVHGACVKDGGWWWHRTAAALAESGIASETPLLPSCGETGAAGLGFAEDVASVRSVLGGSDEPTVLVGHSYGGIVATEAAAGAGNVAHMLFVSSYLAEPGESLATFGPEEPAPFLEVDPDAGTFRVSSDAFLDTFMQDCDEQARRESLDKLAEQSVSVVEAPVSVASWKDVPTSYLVCAQDLGTPAERQRGFAERAARVVELEAGHHPFLSQPGAVAEIIAAAA